MILNKQLLSTLVISLIFACQVNGSGNAAAFIEKDLSPRGLAMGTSLVSLAEGSDALYWNPALLSKATYSDIQIFSNTAYDAQYLGVRGTFDFMSLNWGFGVTNVGIGEINEVVKDNQTQRYVSTGTQFSYGGNMVLLGTGLGLSDDISIGFTGKYIIENAAGFEASGFGADLGFYNDSLKDTKIGITVQNLIQPQLQWNTSSSNIETISQKLIVGIAHTFMDGSLALAVSGIFEDNRGSQFSLGAEYWPCSFLPIRAGLTKEDISVGTGLILGALSVDISLTIPNINILDSVYRVGLKYSFLKTEKELSYREKLLKDTK